MARPTDLTPADMLLVNARFDKYLRALALKWLNARLDPAVRAKAVSSPRRWTLWVGGMPLATLLLTELSRRVDWHSVLKDAQALADLISVGG